MDEQRQRRVVARLKDRIKRKETERNALNVELRRFRDALYRIENSEYAVAEAEEMLRLDTAGVISLPKRVRRRTIRQANRNSARRLKPYGITPYAFQILKQFLNLDVPIKLTASNAFAAAFGPDINSWFARKLQRPVVGSNSMVPMTYHDDLALVSQGQRSSIWQQIQSGVDKLEHVHEGTIPVGYAATPQLSGLYRALVKDKRDEDNFIKAVVQTIRKWQPPIDGKAA